MSSVRPSLLEITIRLTPGCLDDNHSAYDKYTVCPTRYRTRHFFNNLTTNEDIATKFEADYRHIPLHFSHNERTPIQISLPYLHWC